MQLGIPVALPGPVAEPYAALLAEDWAAAAIYWEKQGRPYRHALALAASDDADALVRALGIAEGLGAGALTARLRERLRQLGVTRVPRGPQRRDPGQPRAGSPPASSRCSRSWPRA